MNGEPTDTLNNNVVILGVDAAASLIKLEPGTTQADVVSLAEVLLNHVIAAKDSEHASGTEASFNLQNFYDISVRRHPKAELVSSLSKEIFRTWLQSPETFIRQRAMDYILALLKSYFTNVDIQIGVKQA